MSMLRYGIGMPSHAAVYYLPIQLFEVDVQAVALWTSRWLILSYTFHIQPLPRGFIQDGFGIFPVDQKFSSAQQVGPSAPRGHRSGNTQFPRSRDCLFASSASGKFWKRRIMTRSRSSMTSTPVAASFRVLSSPLPLISAFRVSRASWVSDAPSSATFCSSSGLIAA